MINHWRIVITKTDYTTKDMKLRTTEKTARFWFEAVQYVKWHSVDLQRFDGGEWVTVDIRKNTSRRRAAK